MIGLRGIKTSEALFSIMPNWLLSNGGIFSFFYCGSAAEKLTDITHIYDTSCKGFIHPEQAIPRVGFT